MRLIIVLIVLVVGFRCFDNLIDSGQVVWFETPPSFCEHIVIAYVVYVVVSAVSLHLTVVLLKNTDVRSSVRVAHLAVDFPISEMNYAVIKRLLELVRTEPLVSRCYVVTFLCFYFNSLSVFIQ